jgi:hypothetical protein
MCYDINITDITQQQSFFFSFFGFGGTNEIGCSRCSADGITGPPSGSLANSFGVLALLFDGVSVVSLSLTDIVL